MRRPASSRLPGSRVAACAILALATAFPAAAQSSRQPADRAPVAYAIVIASTLNVRAEPGLDAQVIGSVARGDTVCVLRTDGDWTEVRDRRSEGSEGPILTGHASRGFLSERRASGDALTAMGCG